MKWGRKKSNNQVSYSLSSLSHFFPISWLSKFKPTNDESEYPLAKTKRKNKPSSPLLNSTLPVSSRPTRLHRKDPSFSPEVPGRRTGRRTKTLSEVDGGDEFCPLSFGGESFAGKKTRGISRSALYDSDFELEFPLSSCHSCRSATKKKETKEESQKFTTKVPNIRKMRDSPAEVKMRSVTCEGQEFEAPTGKILKDGRVLDRKFRKTSQRVLENSVEKNQRSSKPVDRRLDLELETTILTEKNGNCSLTSLGSGKSLSIVGKNSPKTHKFTALNSERTDQLFVEESDSEWERAKELKVKELLSKSEKLRKSIYIRREVQNKKAKQSCKVKVNSPRTPSKMEVCKIRALEDRKKAKMKMATKDRTVEGTTGLENYAVTTCSFNPSKDFRDSMVEMISEYQMKGPEELEDLLACYLTLNSDEYHDLIIKVFRQVWFDLNRPCFRPELQKDDCYTDE